MAPWDASFEVGVKIVDEQHKELIAKVDELHAAMKEGKGREKVNGIIAFLKDYALKHFATEEGLMRVYGYPKYDEHHKLHEEFKTDFVKLVGEMGASTNLTLLTMEVQHRLANWLVNHIRRVDKETFQYLATKGVH